MKVLVSAMLLLLLILLFRNYGSGYRRSQDEWRRENERRLAARMARRAAMYPA
jgi:hypothetical protein